MQPSRGSHARGLHIGAPGRVATGSYGSCFPQYCHPALAALPFQQLLHMAQPLGAGGMPVMRAAFQQQATAPQLGYGYVTPAVPYAAPTPAFNVNTAAMGTAAMGAAAAGAAEVGTCLPRLLGVTQRELRPTVEVVADEVHQGATGPVHDMSLFAPLGHGAHLPPSSPSSAFSSQRASFKPHQDAPQHPYDTT